MLIVTGPVKQLKAIVKTFSKAKGVSFEFEETHSEDDGIPNVNEDTLDVNEDQKDKAKHKAKRK
jgi:hypothetical protein